MSHLELKRVHLHTDAKIFIIEPTKYNICVCGLVTQFFLFGPIVPKDVCISILDSFTKYGWIDFWVRTLETYGFTVNVAFLVTVT